MIFALFIQDNGEKFEYTWLAEHVTSGMTGEAETVVGCLSAARAQLELTEAHRAGIRLIDRGDDE